MSGQQTDFSILEVLVKLAETLALSARGDMEIVVHDLTRMDRSIVKIVNGHLSGRREGDTLAATPIAETRFRKAFGDTGQPHEVREIHKRTSWISPDRPVQSDSLMFFDGAGKARAMLCINIDERVSGRLRADFATLFGLTPALAKDETDAKDNHMGHMVQEIVDEAIATAEAPVERMSKAEKIQAVSAMHERGVFLMRGSVEYVAKRLDVTKHTIYNYFDVLGISR